MFELINLIDGGVGGEKIVDSWPHMTTSWPTGRDVISVIAWHHVGNVREADFRA